MYFQPIISHAYLHQYDFKLLAFKFSSAFTSKCSLPIIGASDGYYFFAINLIAPSTAFLI
jgi:hypothetical protein